MKKHFVWILILCLLLGACSSESADSTQPDVPSVVAEDDGVTTVGICLPSDKGRWAKEGEALAEALDVGNYEVELAYGNNDAQHQADQIGTMIAGDVDCLIVAAVDSLVLTDVLDQARMAGIPVIAYDRLLMQTEGVTCYVALDAYAAGKAMAEYIVNEKQLTTAKDESRSYTVEFFMGAPEDNNALLLHSGILEVLRPYLDSGVLTCPSRRTAFEDCCIAGWSEKQALSVCETYLKEYYAQTMPDILCAASDSLAAGVCKALEKEGYTEGPLVTGRGAELTGVERLQFGQQSMTMYAPAEELVLRCVQTADALLRGTEPEYNDTSSCHNGSKTVPAYLLPEQTVTPDNYTQILPEGSYVPQEEPESTETSPTSTTQA